MTLRIKTKRWNDPREPDDGFRLLICRYRPRGVAKDAETWDGWWPELGPSKELHAAFWGKGQTSIGWDEYQRRFRAEIAGQEQKIAWLARSVARGEPLTLLCSSACTDEARCHRSIVRELVTAAAGAAVGTPRTS
jgi:uncharacterized protein YeaO (DUF488 family)